MVDVTERVLGIEWIEGKSIRMLLGGGAEGEEEQLFEPEESPDDDTTDASGESVSHVDPLDEYQVTIGMSLTPTIFSPSDLSCADEIMRLIGSEIAKMHRSDIIHGDLTTSNMIIRHPFATKGPLSTKLVCGLHARRCPP